MSIHGRDASPWVRQGRTFWAGPGDCRVAACHLGGETESWRFSAWGAAALPELSYWQWHEAANLPVCSERGQALTQRRPLLGVYPTAAEARAACLAWLDGLVAGGDEGVMNREAVESGEERP